MGKGHEVAIKLMHNKTMYRIWRNRFDSYRLCFVRENGQTFLISNVDKQYIHN